MSERIEITIDEAGETQVAVKGCAGTACKALTANIENALGEVKSDAKTGEYYQRATTGQNATHQR